MKFSLPHNGTQTEGIAHLHSLLAEHRAELEKNASDVKIEWRDNVLSFSFTAQKTHIEGDVTVLDKRYDVYAKLPLALRLFERRIERMIAEEAKKHAL